MSNIKHFVVVTGEDTLRVAAKDMDEAIDIAHLYNEYIDVDDSEIPQHIYEVSTIN